MKFAFILMLSFVSLGTYSQTEKQKDSAARNLAPIENKAIVYILRPTSFGSAIRMNVHCDSTLIGTTNANSYLYLIVDPGNYLIRSKAENKSELPVTVEAGKIYYIEQSVKMGIVYARANLLLVDEEKGKKFMKKCKLAKSNEYMAMQN